MKQTTGIIEKALEQAEKPCLAYSGGSDSTVLADILYRRMRLTMPMVYCDDQMGYDSTLPFVRSIADRYGAELIVARASRTPREQWARQGWPMLGKLAARQWMQKHKGRSFGFRLDVSSCCQNMKIAPARKAVKKAGCDLQFTGQRGNVDDALRGMRAARDGAIHYVKSARLTVASPLIGWTDTMIRRYHEQCALPVHPARQTGGACTIGCLYCGGGAQFDNSGFRILRRNNPTKWRWLMVDAGAGEIILAIKHDKPLEKIRAAVEHLGGLAAIAGKHPHLFDFLRYPPLKGYTK